MMSQKLKTIFIISIPVFIAHGLEEFFNGFYNVDWSFKFVFGFLNTMTVPQATFLVFQIMLWLAFIVFAFLIASEKWRLRKGHGFLAMRSLGILIGSIRWPQIYPCAGNHQKTFGENGIS